MSWGNLSRADDATYEALFDEYVPACGKAKTLGGEILRAISRIVYRYYNDGDTVWHYYGGTYNYLITADEFLDAYVDGYESLKSIAFGKMYEDVLCANLKTCLDYVVKYPKVFETPNERDFIEESYCERCKVKEYDWCDYDDECDEDDDY